MANETNYIPCKYKGNGTTQNFPFAWGYFDDSEIIVNIENSSGVQTVLTLGTDYDVTPDSTGGEVICKVAPTSEEYIIISRDTSNLQKTRYSTSVGFQGTEIEKSFDKVSCCLQDIVYSSKRAIKIPIGSTALDLSLPQPNAGKTLKWNEDNTGLINSDVNIDDIDDAVQTAKDYSEQAQNSATNASNSANQSAENLAASEQVRNNILALGIFMQDDRLFYYDNTGVKHEFRNDFGGIPPMAVKHKEVKKTDDGFVLTWSDPDDSTYQNNVYCTWGNTLIIRKEGSYPASPFDGAIVVNNTVRNKYATNGYLDEVDSTKDWYYRAFPCSINKVYNLDDFNKFGLWVYSFTRLKNESVPSEKIVYRGTNKYYQKAYNDYTAGKVKLCDWENAPFLLKDRLAPCAVNFDGELEYFLDRNDFTKKEDGTASNNSDTTTDLNFYIRIKLLYRRLKKNANGDTEVDISNKQVNNEYKPYGCFIKPDGTLREYIYFPIYKGSFIDGKVRSIAGQTPMSGKTAEQERAGCQANGTGHDMVTIAELDLMRDLYMLMFADTDSQTALGQGKSNGGENVGACLNSGTMDKKGMFSGSTSTAEGVKFCGAENPYSSQWTRYLGEVLVNGVRKVKLCQGTSDGSTVSDFNFTGEGYIALTELPTITGTSSGFISQSETVDDIGTFPVVVSGSSTTNECDKMWFNNSGTMVALRGGASNNGVGCGFFCSYLNSPASNASWNIGSSVSYKPL